jgi:hypothetical protein
LPISHFRRPTLNLVSRPDSNKMTVAPLLPADLASAAQEGILLFGSFRP